MTHNEIANIFINNLEERNKVFENIFAKLSELLGQKNNKYNYFIEDLMHFARKNNQRIKATETKMSYYNEVVHTPTGIRYYHRSYGPDLDYFNIDINENRIKFTHKDRIDRYFELPSNKYNLDIIRNGLELLKNYSRAVENYSKGKNSDQRNNQFSKNDNQYYIEVQTGAYYKQSRYNYVLLKINKESYLINKKEFVFSDMNGNGGNFLFDIEEEKKKEEVITNFIPILTEHLNNVNKEINEAENKIKEYLAPYLVMKELKKK